MIVRDVLLVVSALLMTGCASESWVGRYVPVDGGWGAPAGGQALVTIDREAEGKVSGSFTDAAGRTLPLELERGEEDASALFAPGVDLGKDGLTLPVQGQVDDEAGSRVLKIAGTNAVRGKARVSLQESSHDGYLLIVQPLEEEGGTGTVHLAKAKP